MINEIMASLHNFFELKGATVEDSFTIAGGVITASHRTTELARLQSGQYYRIVGSIFNDGVHIWGAGDTLINEEFTGCVIPLAPPRAFIELCDDIQAWERKNGEAAASLFTAESFGGYSYQRPLNADGSAKGWQDAFKGRLDKWRRI